MVVSFSNKSTLYKLNSKTSQTFDYIIKYFSSLTHSLNIYKKLSKNQDLDDKSILNKYKNLILFSLKLSQLYLNRNLILLTQLSNLKINTLQHFLILKENLEYNSSSSKLFSNSNKLLNLKSTIYFSKTLKDQLRYTFKKITDIGYLPDRHQYTKSKTRLLIFNEDHKVQTSYDKIW